MEPTFEIRQEMRKAQANMLGLLSGFGQSEGLPQFLTALVHSEHGKTMGGSMDLAPFQKSIETGPMARANELARWRRANPRANRLPSYDVIAKSRGVTEFAKAELDVGTLTNFAQVTGGQTMGYVSLDTMMARGTIRPRSFTLYQCLDKTAANQVVDFWPYAAETGGSLPGGAFASYASVGTGTLNTNAGVYDMKSITLQLAVDGRAITTALASQNSFVDVAQQENTNAALTVLETINWACYWGNPTLFPNQFAGLNASIPTQNKYDFAQFQVANAARGWSNEQALFNMIYDVAGNVTGYRTFGVITHAFMSPNTAGSLQSIVTTLLNNLTNTTVSDGSPIIVNGDFQGMKTRFGDIQFPVDILINSRNTPAAAIVYENGTTPATTTGPTPPVSVAVAAVSGTAGSDFTAAYAASGYVYAVASLNASMTESLLTLSANAAAVTAGGSYNVTITPPAAGDANVFRVYRSGMGLTTAATTGLTTAQIAGLFRYVGSIAANGATPVVFADLNTNIPGSEAIFLLDLDESDNAVDFRYLLPLSRISLFASNLYMPWAVAMIGAIRNRIPKFHGLIRNYVPTNPSWNPLSTNVTNQN